MSVPVFLHKAIAACQAAKFVLRWSGMAGLIFLCVIYPVRAASGLSYEKAKSIFIYKIFLNVQWPDEKNIEQFTLGLYGQNNSLLHELRDEFEGKSIRGKPVRIITANNLAKASSLHALVLAQNYNQQLHRIALRLRQSGTLLITDGAVDKRSVMINFIETEAGRLGFEINRSSMLYEGLVPSKNMLLFGGTELDIAAIHKETEAELAKAIHALEKQRQELDSQQGLLKQQSARIAAQAASIESQKSVIRDQSDEIARQGEEISSRKSKLSQLEQNMMSITKALTDSENILSEKIEVLSKKEADIDLYSTRIQENLTRIRAQKSEIELHENLIAEKNAVLSQQIATIKNQQFILAAAVIAMIVFLALMILIYKSARDKLLVNKKLQNKTRELQTANEKLTQMSEAKSQFLSTMSHEIRTPLNGVLGMVELLRDTPVNEQQQRYLDTVYSSGEVLLSIINDVLDYSKIEAGKMPIESLEFDLEQLVFSCTSVFAKKTSPSLSFIVDIKPETPVSLMGDPTRIRQIILNLLSNAFKFTSVGEIRIEVQPVERENEEASYSISVRDTGIGLDEQQCNVIFNAFTQADCSTTRRFGGTGLGLAICMQLARMMGGSIRVDSELGEGSVFTLTLPLKAVETEPSEFVKTLSGSVALVVGEADAQQQIVINNLAAWNVRVIHLTCLEEVEQVLADGILREAAFIIVTSALEDRNKVSLARAFSAARPELKVILLDDRLAPVGHEDLDNNGVGYSVIDLPVAPSVLSLTMSEMIASPIAVPESEMVSNSKEGVQKSPLNSHHQVFSGNILVAEDNNVNQVVIKGFLQKLGITPEIVSNGREAVDAYKKRCQKDNDELPYDLILMDCEMPIMDGFHATEAIRLLESERKLPPVAIVALTAHAMDAQRDKTFAAGMDGHLAKPLEMRALQAMLVRFVSRSHSAG